jgi:hypothetical protein
MMARLFVFMMILSSFLLVQVGKIITHNYTQSEPYVCEINIFDTGLYFVINTFVYYLIVAFYMNQTRIVANENYYKWANVMTVEKKKVGRPVKDKKGALIWVQSEYVEAIKTFLEVLKGYKPNQQAAS